MVAEHIRFLVTLSASARISRLFEIAIPCLYRDKYASTAFGPAKGPFPYTSHFPVHQPFYLAARLDEIIERGGVSQAIKADEELQMACLVQFCKPFQKQAPEQTRQRTHR